MAKRRKKTISTLRHRRHQLIANFVYNADDKKFKKTIVKVAHRSSRQSTNQLNILTSLVHGPLIKSGLTTLAHRCWHCTSDLSGKLCDTAYHFSPWTATKRFSRVSYNAWIKINIAAHTNRVVHPLKCKFLIPVTMGIVYSTTTTRQTSFSADPKGGARIIN